MVNWIKSVPYSLLKKGTLYSRQIQKQRAGGQIIDGEQQLESHVSPTIISDITVHKGSLADFCKDLHTHTSDTFQSLLPNSLKRQ